MFGVHFLLPAEGEGVNSRVMSVFLLVTPCLTDAVKENFPPRISTVGIIIYGVGPRWDFFQRGFFTWWGKNHRGRHGLEVFIGPVSDDIKPPRKYNFPARRSCTAQDRLSTNKGIIIQGGEVLIGPISQYIKPPRKYNFPARRSCTAQDRLSTNKGIIIQGGEVLIGPISQYIKPPRKYNFPARRSCRAQDRLEIQYVLKPVYNFTKDKLFKSTGDSLKAYRGRIEAPGN